MSSLWPPLLSWPLGADRVRCVATDLFRRRKPMCSFGAECYNYGLGMHMQHANHLKSILVSLIACGLFHSCARQNMLLVTVGAS